MLSCSVDGKIDLWSADDGSGRQLWELNDPLVHVGFEIDQGIISSTAPHIVAEQTLANTTSTTQSMSFQVEESVDDTSFFESSTEVALSVGTSFETGVPYVEGGEISTELTTSFAQTFGETTSATKTVSGTFPLETPSKMKVVCKALVTKFNLEVPYVFTYASGTVEKGTWHGVSAEGLESQLEEESLDDIE